MHLSERISTESVLVKLGVTGLRLPDYVIQTALTNHSKDIVTASYKVLQEWRKYQEDNEKAFTNLQDALRRCEMGDLAALVAEHFPVGTPLVKEMEPRE